MDCVLNISDVYSVWIKSLYGTFKYCVSTANYYWRTILEIFSWVVKNLIYSAFYIIQLVDPTIVQWLQLYGVYEGEENFNSLLTFQMLPGISFLS